MRKMTGASSGKFSLREISPQSTIARRETTRNTRDSLPATLKVKLVTLPLRPLALLLRTLLPCPNLSLCTFGQDQWEATLSFGVISQVLRIMERFSEAVEEGAVFAEYEKAENFTAPLAAMLRVNQPMSFWQLFPAVFSRIIRRQGREILGPGKEKLVKDLAFSIMKRMVYKSDYLRQRAVVCLLLLVKVCSPPLLLPL